jgi:antitoxin component of MazEF toxin-antitoxin module
VPQKETRKIIKIGNTSLGVILPKGWLQYAGLRHGDRVEVVTNGVVTVKPIMNGKLETPAAPS